MSAAVNMMDLLPAELVLIVLMRLDERSLVHLAAVCRSLADISDSVAEAQCAAGRGQWSQGLSWRLQLCGERRGRLFRASNKVLQQLGSSGTRRKASSQFQKPVAVASLSEGRIVVCNSGSRSLGILKIATGALMESVPIDGVPGGVCLLDPQSDLVAISVQGTAESGGSLPGVQNPHHRVEAYSLPLAEPATLLWVHDTTQLSYPNGLAVTPLAPHYHRRNLLISDWNHHRVAAIRCTDEGDWREPPLPGFAHDPYEAVVPSDEHHPERRGWRPCDVAILPTREGERSDARFAETAPYAVAVADYYGKAVHIYLHGVSLFHEPHCERIGELGAKRRGRASALDRPSGLAVEVSGGDWARLLVAETGGMCVSVFHVWHERPKTGLANRVAYCSRHLCDIGVEQLGSGLHAPMRGEWGWLGVARMPNGDVVVSDCDHDSVLIL